MVLPGGPLAPVFWYGFILIGLVFPAVVELWHVIPRLLYGKAFKSPRLLDVLVTATVIFGGFLLRYVVVIAGQITGPVGI